VHHSDWVSGEFRGQKKRVVVRLNVAARQRQHSTQVPSGNWA